VCRHVAYLGQPVRLGEVLVDPDWALLRQAWAPRQQTNGVVNADGFGVGWYAPDDPTPALYRRDRPIWADASFADLARVVRSQAFLAAVRSASPGMALGENAAAPFVHRRWLFSHNGVIKGYPESVAALAATLSAERLLAMQAPTDSALLWALLIERLDSGAGLGEALVEVVTLVEGACEARLNLLVTDGVQIAATAAGNSLHVLREVDSVVVASEPHDDHPGWRPVPDRSLVVVSGTCVSVSPLKS
jgi:glutamine amidotransferase